jgi:hypothetical protein
VSVAAREAHVEAAPNVDGAPLGDGGEVEHALRPYEAICAYAERELELAGRGELARLTELGVRWEELIAGLPARPPLAAAELLQRAHLIHERTRIELDRLREALLGEIATATRSRRTANAYAGQLRRRPRLDRSA